MAVPGPPQHPYPHGPPPGAPPAAPGPKPFDPKMTAYILAGCAVAILIGVFTKSWMTGRGGLSGVGPLGVEVCFASTCQGRGWDGAPATLQLPAYLALFGGIAGAAASAYIAFLVLSNAPNKFPAFKIINGALGIAAFATTFFAVRLLIEGQEMSISWSPVFAIGGVVAAGIFMRKLRPYWPGQGNTPWPVAVKPIGHAGAGGYGAPMGGPPGGGYGAPQGQPYGAPQGQPYGAPQGQPYGAPQGQPYGAPIGGPPGVPPYGAPHGAPPSGPPMGSAPSGPPPGAVPFTYGEPHAGPYGPPPLPGAPPIGGAPSVPPPPMAFGAPSSQPPQPAPARPPLGGLDGAANPPPGGAPLPYAPTMAASGSPSNKATVLGAPAPQLAALLKQQPAGAAPQAAQGAQFCGRCGKPMTFVAQYQRWFCEGCQQYG